MRQSISHGDIPVVQQLEVSAYAVPTDGHESDDTIEWDATTIVLVEAVAGPYRGMGYTYATAGVGRVIRDHLTPVVAGQSPWDIPSTP